MGKHEKNETRCPFGGRIICFMISAVLIFDIVTAMPVKAAAKPIENIRPKQIAIATPEINLELKPVVDTRPRQITATEVATPEPALKSNEEIISEINSGLWGDGDERKTRLTEAGYDYAEVQALVNAKYPAAPKVTHTYNGVGLTKRGGVYWNPNTGLKETWYSQRVLPGGGLNIPGRHVNSEGFVCDGDGYICVSSSTYPKGTVIETSRGIGKVYDAGCAPGVLDIYVNW